MFGISSSQGCRGRIPGLVIIVIITAIIIITTLLNYYGYSCLLLQDSFEDASLR